MHQAALTGDNASATLDEVDRLAGRMWELDSRELGEIRREMEGAS